MIVLRKEEFLDSEFLPSEIFHRENEINQIKSSIKPIFQKRKGDNLFIHGLPCVGKTTTLKHVLSQIDGIKTVYLNCWLYKTPHSFLGEIARQVGIPVPRKGRGTDEIINNILKKGNMIIVFDEVDKAERIDDIYPLIEKTKSIFIFITNNREWILRLEPRVSSRLFLTNIEFKSYSFEQMEDIIKWRIKMAFKPSALSPELITEVSRRAFLKRDVRNGLFLLKKIARRAENDGLDRVEINIFEKIQGDFKLKPVLTENEEIIVGVIKSNQGKTTGELYDIYSKKGSLTQRAFRMYIKKLSEKSVLDVEETGKGFRGRSRRIFLNKKYGV